MLKGRIVEGHWPQRKESEERFCTTVTVWTIFIITLEITRVCKKKMEGRAVFRVENCH